MFVLYVERMIEHQTVHFDQQLIDVLFRVCCEEEVLLILSFITGDFVPCDHTIQKQLKFRLHDRFGEGEVESGWIKGQYLQVGSKPSPDHHQQEKQI